MNTNPSQNYKPNPNGLLFHPNQLDNPMTRQQNNFYDRNQSHHIPIPQNIGPSLPPFGNLNTAFNPLPSIPFNGSQPKAMFNNHGFVNRGDLLHNDLYSIILNEEIREYSILIDSKDRNIEVYPNPFRYKVTFHPLPTTRAKANGRTIIYETPTPVINQEMCNVRYIVLEDVILPFFTTAKIVKKEIGTEVVLIPKIDTTTQLTDYLYIVLSIEEYTDVNCRSTNDVLSDSFATIYYDSATNRTHYAGRSRNGIKIFQPDQLGTITTFKIRFMNPYGEELTINDLDRNVASSLQCTCGPNFDPDTTEPDPDCFRHNLFHPLNPVFQHHLHFRVGIVEPRLNKKVFS